VIRNTGLVTDRQGNSQHTKVLRKQMAKPVLVVPHVLEALEDSALFVVITRWRRAEWYLAGPRCFHASTTSSFPRLAATALPPPGARERHTVHHGARPTCEKTRISGTTARVHVPLRQLISLSFFAATGATGSTRGRFSSITSHFAHEHGRLAKVVLVLDVAPLED